MITAQLSQLASRADGMYVKLFEQLREVLPTKIQEGVCFHLPADTISEESLLVYFTNRTQQCIALCDLIERERALLNTAGGRLLGPDYDLKILEAARQPDTPSIGDLVERLKALETQTR